MKSNSGNVSNSKNLKMRIMVCNTIGYLLSREAIIDLGIITKLS